MTERLVGYWRKEVMFYLICFLVHEIMQQIVSRCWWILTEAERTVQTPCKKRLNFGGNFDHKPDLEIPEFWKKLLKWSRMVQRAID